MAGLRVKVLVLDLASARAASHRIASRRSACSSPCSFLECMSELERMLHPHPHPHPHPHLELRSDSLRLAPSCCVPRPDAASSDLGSWWIRLHRTRLTGEVRRRAMAHRPGGLLGSPRSRIRARTPARSAAGQAQAGPSEWHCRELVRLTAPSERHLTRMARGHRPLWPFVQRDPAARCSLVHLFSAHLGTARPDAAQLGAAQLGAAQPNVALIAAQLGALGRRSTLRRSQTGRIVRLSVDLLLQVQGEPQNGAEAGAKRGRWRPGFAPGPGYFPALSSGSNSFDPCRSSWSNALDPITERSVESSRSSSAPRCTSPARATACSSTRADASTPLMPSKRSVSRPPEVSTPLARSLPAGALAGLPADAPPGTPAARSANCRATRRTVARKSSRLEGKLA